jgi:hypothetical protein
MRFNLSSVDTEWESIKKPILPFDTEWESIKNLSSPLIQNGRALKTYPPL